MKKTISIHISGYIFNIEEDAYKLLEEWLNKLSKQYSEEEGGDEIINDIEIRTAEILQQELGTDKTVVTEFQVQKVFEIIGIAQIGESICITPFSLHLTSISQPQLCLTDQIKGGVCQRNVFFQYRRNSAPFRNTVAKDQCVITLTQQEFEQS